MSDANQFLFGARPVVFAAALSQSQLLLCALAVVAGLILLITRWKVPAFIALLLASLAAGLCAGLSVGEICKSFQEGVGSVLGSIAVIVGLGTVLGKLLAESGGAQQIAQRLLGLFGPQYLSWTMLLLGFVVGVPVFFGVGLVLLAPILYAVKDKTETSFLRLAIPLVAGLSAAHGLAPPHPGPLTAMEILRADAGKTVFYSLLIGAGAAMVSGPVLCRVCARSWNRIEPASALGREFASSAKNPPPFWPTLLTVLLPVLLMMLATAADLTLAPGQPVRKVADALGAPLGAMLIAVLLAFQILGTGRGFDRKTILKFTEDCMAPIASILLVIGAGGGFSRVLVAGGVGDAIADFARHAPVSPLIFGWLLAAVIRVATGSATVAITTAAGMVAPLAAAGGVNRELLVIVMGAGSLVLSHVNDGGFWLVKEYLGLSVGETLKSWTVMETTLSVAALLLALLVNMMVG